MAAKRKKTDPKLAKLYAQAKREFTITDLLKYLEDTPTVPARQVLAELEVMYQKHLQKKSGKKKNGTNGRKKSA